MSQAVPPLTKLLQGSQALRLPLSARVRVCQPGSWSEPGQWALRVQVSSHALISARGCTGRCQPEVIRVVHRVSGGSASVPRARSSLLSHKESARRVMCVCARVWWLRPQQRRQLSDKAHAFRASASLIAQAVTSGHSIVPEHWAHPAVQTEKDEAPRTVPDRTRAKTILTLPAVMIRTQRRQGLGMKWNSLLRVAAGLHRMYGSNPGVTEQTRKPHPPPPTCAQQRAGLCELETQKLALEEKARELQRKPLNYLRERWVF